MSTARLEYLKSMETTVQQKWDQEKPFEAEPNPGQEKFFVTFPYPYMNGKLHLGHGFSFTKAEFAARYWRLKGKNVLCPFGLHVTGTPIAACAQKLKNEINQYGNPPNFPKEVLEGQKKEEDQSAEAAMANAGKYKAKRSKIGPPKPQWVIMESMGLPKEEIVNFAEADHWLDYFPPRALVDIKRLGAHVDYRRSFITTDVNPFYDSFVRWQFEMLQKKELLAFGKRYCIYSPLDGQPCADHDRASGEGVQPVEYCVVRIQVRDPAQQEALKPFADKFEGKNVVLPGATLRAETVVGLTNLWMSPEVNYKAFEVQIGDQQPEVWLTTSKAVANLAFQDIKVNGKVYYNDATPLFEVNGAELIGLPCVSPYGPYETVYTLPMSTITENKGTACVLSVPSDSPDDWINFQQFLKKPDYRTKMNIKDEWVLPFEPVPIINIPDSDFGENAAEVACGKCKVGGPKDSASLEEAKKMAYQAGFYSGVMTTGPYTGMKVSEAKVKMAMELIEKQQACKYQEPQKEVISRSGEECVVALTDQWFLRYGKEDWKKLVKEHLPNMDMFYNGIRSGFEETLEWLGEWPCSRNFGLGTQLENRSGDASKVIIDSLSDSTIYMAYYTLAKYFHETEDGTLNLRGRLPNKYGITPEMMAGNKPWDFILKNIGTAEEVQAATGLPADVAEKMRAEFNYFYPVDLRVSGKDLIQNHLTMFLYNHAAIWEEDKSKWPQAIYCNGHIMINGAKMAKSAGNFVLLADAFDQYSADGTRMALADSGDSMDDANFVTETATSFIMKLTNLIDLFKKQWEKLESMRGGERTVFDKIFENSVNACIVKCDANYQKMNFRSVLVTAFNELQNEFSMYDLYCGTAGTHKDVISFYLSTLIRILAPLIPHTAEHLWCDVMKLGSTVMSARFPEPTAPEDMGLSMAGKLIQDVCHEIRTQGNKIAKKKDPTVAYVYVAPDYQPWQQKGLAALAEQHKMCEEAQEPFNKSVLKNITGSNPDWIDKKKMQEVMAFLAFALNNAEKYGVQALSVKPPVDDETVLRAAEAYMKHHTDMPAVTVLPNTDQTHSAHAKARESAGPGLPKIVIEGTDKAQK